MPVFTVLCQYLGYRARSSEKQGICSFILRVVNRWVVWWYARACPYDLVYGLSDYENMYARCVPAAADLLIRAVYGVCLAGVPVPEPSLRGEERLSPGALQEEEGRGGSVLRGTSHTLPTLVEGGGWSVRVKHHTIRTLCIYSTK